MYGIVTKAHAQQQAYYERRIAREGLLAALAPYGITARHLPARRSVDAARPLAD